jgi:hypothetical protein
LRTGVGANVVSETPTSLEHRSEFASQRRLVRETIANFCSHRRIVTCDARLGSGRTEDDRGKDRDHAAITRA